ncbi:MAG: hypothetical protein HQ523_12755 [Lentisphaerae bacterium]|nr:hypothetical protein [Lentisphaerota bacterium]
MKRKNNAMQTCRAMGMVVAVIVAMGISGCRTADLTVSLRPTEYTVTALVLQLSAEGATVLGDGAGPALEATVRRWDTKTERMPTIHISPGETRDIDERKVHKYPVAFDQDGKPKRYDESKEGILFRTTLLLLPDGTPVLRILIDATRMAEWKTFSRSGQEFRFPILDNRKIETTVRPKWGQWLNIGELTPAEGEKGLAIVVRLDRPTGAQ